jgi:hypothetical protein
MQAKQASTFFVTLAPAAAAAAARCCQLRLDAKVPGTVLMRDKDGYVYFVTINNIQQVRHAAAHHGWLLGDCGGGR